MAIPKNTLKGYTNVAVENFLDALHWGPICAPIHVSSHMFFYKGGIIKVNECDQGPNNHVVMVVGYGYSFKDECFYLILRNNWGDEWGDKGYFYLDWNHQGTLNPCSIKDAPFSTVMPLGMKMETYNTIKEKRRQINDNEAYSKKIL